MKKTHHHHKSEINIIFDGLSDMFVLLSFGTDWFYPGLPRGYWDNQTIASEITLRYE